MSGVQQQLDELQIRLSALEALLAQTAADLSARIRTIENGGSNASGSPVVVNAQGAVIGYFVPQDRFLYKHGSEWIYIGPLLSDGFADTGFLQLYYSQDNCEGPAYVHVLPGRVLARFGTVVDGVVYYGGDPVAVTIRSGRNGTMGPCATSAGPHTRVVGQVYTFETTAFGPPPFRVR